MPTGSRPWAPYLKWRGGRPRWEPGPRLRAKGFKGRDLRSEAGQWLGLEAAIAAAREINAGVDAWRREGAPRRRERAPRRSARSCRALFERYWQSADFLGLAASTRADYRLKQEIFLSMAVEGATLGDAPAAAIRKPTCFGIWEEAYAERGLHMANAIKAAVSPVFSYAELVGWREAGSNPWLRLGRPQAPARLAIWLPAQVNAFLAAADADPDTRSVGDAFLLGLHSAQRLSDVLAMPPRLFTEGRIALTQMKRKALIDVKMTAQVLERVAQIRARPFASLETLIVNEETGRTYDAREFNKRFRLVRARAAAALPKVQVEAGWQGPKVHEIAELRFQDLRDTAVTRLALAGNDAAHIAAVTGHSLASITQIMKHYLALNRAMADTATDRLEAWLAAEGIAV